MALKTIAFEAVTRFTALIVGQAGVGKTSLLRTIPEDEPVLVISAEAGLLCVRDLIESKRVQGWEVETFADLAEVYAYLITPDAGVFKWVFFDSLTEISARCVDAMKAKYPSKTDSFPMWNEYTEKMTTFIKAYRDLGRFNVIFTCLPSTEKDEMNRQFTSLCISGTALKERVPGWFDEFFHMVSLPDSEGKESRALITQPWTKYPGKDRSGKLALVEAPHLGNIKAKILGGAPS